MSTVKKQIRVVAALIREENMVFATQRGYGDYKDWWEFPGGKIESGETPEDALIREIQEELETKIHIDRYLATVEYDYPEFHLSMACYWCRIAEGKPTLLEHEAARWLPLSDLRQVNWLPADLLVIEEIEKQSKDAGFTLRYYEDHAEEFTANTIHADMKESRCRFLAHLPAEARILDFGCGSGRDTKVFLDAGYSVDAADGSAELCKTASEYTGIPVKQMLFQELSAKDTYDGIWACASILHLPKPELSEVLKKISLALKPEGVLYTSFKYGTFEGLRNGRYFTDFTEDSLDEFWRFIPSLVVFDIWITRDVRPGREEERWINLLARRI